jgi:GTP-binding protein HflX
MPVAKSSPSSPSSPVSITSAGLRAVLVAAPSPDRDESDATRSLAELAQLLRGIGIEPTDTVVQRRGPRGAPAYLGEGKLREVAAITGGPGVVARGPDAARPTSTREDLIVVADDELTPGQIRQLGSALGAEVIDRASVILRVFASRARTREAQLEIELARLTYELPRVRDDGEAGDREGGGGRAARGHTNVELAKQRVRDRIGALRRELEVAARAAAAQRRQRDDVFRVALVGYTNAGKSSLMRALTGSDVLVEDKLFATLGTTARKLHPPSVPPTVVIDSVGFLHRLPHPLVASFHSTLAEARDASLLVHVVDASDPEVERQRTVTEEVLAELGLSLTESGATPSLLVLNKADRLDEATHERLAGTYPDAILASAFDPAGVARVRAAIDAKLDAMLAERAFAIPYDKAGVLAQVRDRVRVVDEAYGEEVRVTVRGTTEMLDQLATRLTEA